MPDRKVIQRAKEAKTRGASPSSQAGEFVREEIHKIRRGEHGARSAKQAIAIGLSQARRAGVNLKPPPKGKVSVTVQLLAGYFVVKGESSLRLIGIMSRSDSPFTPRLRPKAEQLHRVLNSYKFLRKAAVVLNAPMRLDMAPLQNANHPSNDRARSRVP